MGFFSAVGDFIGGVLSGVGSFLSEGLSMVLDGVTGIATTIGDGIKAICEAVGSEKLALIGCIAISILIPGFGLPELLTLIQCIAEVAKILGVNEGQDSPQELGMKAEIADKKPEDFDSIEQYIKYLNEEVELEKDSVEKLEKEDKVKYGLLGTALNIKAIEEKYDITLSPEFICDVSKMKLSGEEVSQFIRTFKENGINKMQDMTDYLKGNPIETEKSEVSDSIKEAISELNPKLNKQEVEVKLFEMRDELQIQ